MAVTPPLADLQSQAVPFHRSSREVQVRVDDARYLRERGRGQRRRAGRGRGPRRSDKALSKRPPPPHAKASSSNPVQTHLTEAESRRLPCSTAGRLPRLPRGSKSGPQTCPSCSLNQERYQRRPHQHSHSAGLERSALGGGFQTWRSAMGVMKVHASPIPRPPRGIELGNDALERWSAPSRKTAALRKRRAGWLFQLHLTPGIVSSFPRMRP